MPKTIQEIVDDVYEVVTEKDGIDLSPSDVGRIISLFLEGCIHSDDSHPNINQFLQVLADAAGSVTDE
jgi:hypothetical protein